MKQIEEMARKIGELYKDPPQDIPKYDLNIATYLYDAGYRKQSEVAREIFEEIDRFIHKVLNDEHYIMGDMCWDVAELKKKYIEKGE